jgi:hypothetical protein
MEDTSSNAPDNPPGGTSDGVSSDAPANGSDRDRSRQNLVFIILAVAFASVFYRIMVMKRLEQTSLLFIGLPTVLAVVTALTPKARSVTGSILKATTIGLLVSGILLGEGFICILMASPLFYLVAVIVGLVLDAAKPKNRPTALSCLVFLVLVPMSLEGTRPALSFPREESVRAERMVSASSAAVEQALSVSPRVDLPLPLYLRLGFPRPVEAQGAGLRPGDLRRIHFAGGEGAPGDLLLEVAEAAPGRVRFRAVSDRSKIAHWLAWESCEVEWSAVDAAHTRVVWTLRFRRALDPAWYFRPWERYAARLAAEYLIRANATPASRVN